VSGPAGTIHEAARGFEHAPRPYEIGRPPYPADAIERLVAELRLEDGKRVLRFTDFETSNGPDLRVFLVQAADASDSAAVNQAGYTEVAPLKGNVGDQNYEIPADLDLAKYHAVTIWCHRFNVAFGTAPITG